MTDVFSRKKRSEIMSAIKGKGTKLEEAGFVILREAGIRFRKHPHGIFGNPDAAHKGRKIAVFFDSNFWHGYDWQRRKRDIKSNRGFWIPKIERNIARDRKVNRRLKREGWTVVRMWEHQMLSSRRAHTLRRLRRIARSSGLQ